MRVAICTSSLKNENRARGIGFYTDRLIKALHKVDKKNQYIFFTQGKNIPKCDLIHYPYFDFFFLTLPLVKSVKTVVTIHDLIPLVFPQKFPKGVKGWLKFQIQKFSLRGAEAVITDSFNSKKDIVKFLSFPEDKIHVVPLAPDREFKPLGKSPMIRTIRLKYQLPRQFILYVGDVNWNKNISGLIKAFCKLKSPAFAETPVSRRDLKLVLVGRAFLDKTVPETRKLLQLFELLKCRENVFRVGFIPTEDLVAIYNLATVYVQPSFYEGFGLPVLEAMACGTPVVCSKTSSLPEVGGEAVVYVNPYDVDNIARGILEVLCYDTMTHHSRIEKGKKWAKKFSWEKTARETIKVYEKVVGNNF